MIEDVGNQIVAAIANEIEAVERNCARLRPPESLDAWQAYHRACGTHTGLSKTTSPGAFSRGRRGWTLHFRLRAHAGLSFTHWQDAFQHWGDRKARALARAMENAGRGALLADELDPTAHWAMGRAQWLFGRHDAAVDDLKQSVRLSPNFALGHYALAFVQSQSGDPSAAIEAADYSRILVRSTRFCLAFWAAGRWRSCGSNIEVAPGRSGGRPAERACADLRDCGPMSRARRQNRGRAHLRRGDPHQRAPRFGVIDIHFFFHGALRRRCCAVPPGCSTHRSGGRDGARTAVADPAPLGSGGLFARS